MKKIIFVIALILSGTSFSQSADDLFSDANNAYKNGEYLVAIESYKKIEDQGLQSDDLFFNLGNSYYKLNKVAPSIYYYEKALKINPIHEDALTNLAFAKRMTIDNIEVLPKTVLQKISENFIQKLPYDTWALTGVVAAFCIAILFLLYYFSASSSKKLLYFNSTLVGLLVFVLSLVFAYHSYQAELKDRHAIIFAQTANVKNAPTDSSEEVFELHEGTKVMVLDEVDNWKKIKLSDGKIGWLAAENMKEI